MSTIFKRNAIITGYINSCCLVCQHFFETEDETIRHVTSDEHTNNLSAYPYLEKYGNNLIRKVKAGYFCESCSLVMATAAKVTLHISEKQHYLNKGNNLLRQTGSALTAFNNVMIQDSAWNTFSDDTCTLCDTEFDDGNEHKDGRTHQLKLIQNKVLFNDNDSLYRKIDKNDFHCLTCNTMLPLNTLEEHFNSDTHNQTYAECQMEKNKYDKQNVAEINKYEEEKMGLLKQVIEMKSVRKPENIPIEKIVEINVMEKVEANVNGHNGSQPQVKDNVDKKAVASKNAAVETVTKQPKETVAKKTPKKAKTATVAKESVPIEDQKAKLKEDKKGPEKSEPNLPKDETSMYAANNNLAYIPFNSFAFCKTCSKKFPSSLLNMKEHVNGREHVRKTQKVQAVVKKKKYKLEKKKMEQFVFHVRTFDNTTDNDTIINKTYCLEEMSSHTFIKAGNKFHCQICDVFVYYDEEIEDHCGTAKHERGMRNAEIVMNLGKEFVRELRPDVFHCGFCNIVLTNWPDMETHLKNFEHMNSSASCERRLQIHLPMIKAANLEEKVREAFMTMFVNHMRV